MCFSSGFWRKCRTGFRWLRLTALFAVLVLACALVWFNRVGLPDFLNQRLVQTLQARGVGLSFTRMRLNFVHGLVIENVRIGHADTTGDPVLSLAEIQLQLDYRALCRRQWQIDGLVLRQGRLTWPLTPTNVLALANIQADLRFETNDTWALDHFQADLDGAKLTLSGDIIHASEIRNWEVFRGRKSPDRDAWRAQLRAFSDTLDRIHFTGVPQISLAVDGDARNPRSFLARLNLNAVSARTPWGGARDIQFSASLTVPAGTAATTNCDPALAFWTNALPYRLAWTVQLADLKSDLLTADSVICSGRWQAPELAVNQLSARLGGGRFRASARLNVATRELVFTNDSDFDLRAIAALLPEKARGRLGDFSWTRPPVLEVNGSLVAPSWTNAPADWSAAVQPTLRLDGELAFENATILGAQIGWAHTHFSCSNRFWRLPDLAVTQSRTRLAFSGGLDDRTGECRCLIRGALDPAFIRPFLTANNAADSLKYFTFAQPLALDVNVAARLGDADSLGVWGRVALTNFTIRGESVDSVASDLNYTNRVLELTHPRLWHGTQTMTADGITLDFNQRMIRFVNGYSTADPSLVTHAIGPKTAETVDPYQYLRPPTTRVNGCLPLREMNGPRDMEGTDMRFDVIAGAPFRWTRVNLPDITGTLHWMGGVLILTNVQAAFYGGRGAGHACFDFGVPHPGADYNFFITVTNANLHAMMADLSSPTNHLEGILSGQVAVTRADTRDWRTWDGFGRATLQDGLIWDIPVFGILSPVLNSFSSGLGNSRATDATAGFSMTNGVMAFEWLGVRSTMMELKYTGTVDMRENVNLRVTAQLLRNTWMVGPLVSKALWPVSKLFEYHVTGSLENPQSDPVYVPKLLLVPLHPIRSLEEILPAGNGSFSSPASDD